jgi:hypothetical protein
LSRSWFSRLSSRSFPCGCTPTHPFVNASAVTTVVQVVATWHRVFCCDRLALQSRLNQIGARPRGPSPGATSDWRCRRGPLLRSKKGRCNRDSSIIGALVVLFCSWAEVDGVDDFCGSWGERAVGTEERVGGAGGGASSPCSSARCRRNSRTDALMNRSSALSMGCYPAWFMRPSCVASVAVDRPPRTLRCA